MSEEQQAWPPKVIFVHPPSAEEYEAQNLQLAGDDPARRAAVLYWPRIGKSTNYHASIEPIVNWEDKFDALSAKGLKLKPEHVEGLLHFPEITRLELQWSPLSEPIFEIIQKHKVLTALEVSGDPTLDNRICEVASKLPNLEVFKVDSPLIDDQGVEFLANCENLKALTLDGSNITSAAAKHLSQLRNMVSLQITNCKFGDEAIRQIAKLTKLRFLDLSSAEITDESVPELLKLEDLRSLVLNGTYVTDRSVESIAKMERLFRINLNDTEITDRAISLLTNLPKLGELSVRNTAINDSCVADLLKIVHLRMLDIRGTEISRESAKRLYLSLKYGCKSDYGYFPRNAKQAAQQADKLTLQPYEVALPERWFNSSLIDDLDGLWVYPSEVEPSPHAPGFVIKDMKYVAYRYNEREMDPTEDVFRRGPIIGSQGVYFLSNQAALYSPHFLVERDDFKFMIFNKQDYDNYLREGKIPISVLIRVADTLDFKSPPKRPSIRVLGLPVAGE